MKAKFKKYWQRIPPLYCIAAVLDPRVKLQGVDYLLKGIGKKLQVVSDIINIENIKTNIVSHVSRADNFQHDTMIRLENDTK